MRTSTKSLVILLGLFALSVLVRLPHINRPLSTNYEWVTAHTLVTLQIWQEEGIFEHGLSPIYTFPNPNDHHIKCPISGVSDAEGNYYYVSYPPFAFIFPHIIFSSLGIYPDALALETLNLILHLLCAWLVYLILAGITGSKDKLSMPAIAGAAIYLFSPLPLWHHANVYFSDILVQVFFLLGIYLSYLFFFGDKKHNTLISAGLFCTIFLMVYTEWIGVLFAGCLVLVTLLFRKQGLASGRLAMLAIIATTLAGVTFVLQYASINGLDDFLNTAINRYTERSGHTGTNQFYTLNAHLFLANLYLRNYFPQFIIIGFSAFILLILKAKFKTLFKLEDKVVLFIALTPALLHHLILFEFTLVHDMALVKTCVFFSLLSGILFHRILKEADATPGIAFKAVPYVVVVAMLSLSVFLYHAHVIEPEGFSFEELGNDIKQNAGPEDTVFFKTTRTLGDFMIQAPENFVLAPQIQYYAGRCIQVVPSLEEARLHLQKYDKKQGVVFTIENSRYQIENIEYVSVADSLH